jgi:aspartokinase-like uncharacterized kinase
MLMKMFLVVTTFVASTVIIFQQPTMAKENVQSQSMDQLKDYKASTKSLPRLIRAMKRDGVYTRKMRALIKEALAFEKSLGSQTKMTPLIRKKINAKARVLAAKYPKELVTIDKYINSK